MLSTFDVLPTILNLVGAEPLPSTTLDGMDITNILLQTSNKQNQTEEVVEEEERLLFFWKDGFQDGPLPPPCGRFDVVAAKLSNNKAWFYTKSAHYNDDIEMKHDPPSLFNIN